MPNAKSKSRPRRRAPQRPSALLEVNKQILASNQAQQTRAVLAVPDVPRIHLKPLKVHTFRTQFQAISTSAQFGVCTFDLSAFADASSLALLFDQFRVVQLQWDFYGNTNAYNNLVTSLDYTDIVAPTSFVDLLEKESSYVTNTASTTYFARTMSPKYTIPDLSGDPAAIMSTWVPTQVGYSGTAPVVSGLIWGALKFAYSSAPSTQPFDAFCTAIVQFRATD